VGGPRDIAAARRCYQLAVSLRVPEATHELAAFDRKVGWKHGAATPNETSSAALYPELDQQQSAGR
jgi:hypothetical protein